MKRWLSKAMGWALLWLAMPSACPALLDENEDQLEQRYGEHIPELDDHLGPLVVKCYFVRNTFGAMVMLRRGKSISEAYMRPDKQPISERSITAALNGNAGADKWRAVPPEEGVSRQWTLGNKKAVAAYFTTGIYPTLMVCKTSKSSYLRDMIRAARVVQNKSARP